MSHGEVERAIAAIRRGGFVIAVDDAERENEGDLMLAAEMVTPERIAFMVRHTSGLICVPMTAERLEELHLPLMVTENSDTHLTAFTVSVDYDPGTTTGISAVDRAATITALIDPATRPSDLTRPGHVFPLRYQRGGVLARPGHTEAAVDLARLADLAPAAVLSEIVNDDGTMTRGHDLARFAKEHDIPVVSISDLVAYLGGSDTLIERVTAARIPTAFGTYRGVGYRSRSDDGEQVALVLGEVEDRFGVLVRLHSECFTGDTLGSLRCDCQSQFREAQRVIAEEGSGVIIYFRGHEGRGIGLMHKLAAYALQDDGRDTVEANLDLGLPIDSRDYGAGAQILRDLGVKSVRLLTNNPAKQRSLEDCGITVAERVPMRVQATSENQGYLSAKAAKLGHDIEVGEPE